MKTITKIITLGLTLSMLSSCVLIEALDNAVVSVLEPSSSTDGPLDFKDDVFCSDAINSRTTQSTSVPRINQMSTVVNIYEEIKQSTVIVNACYPLNNQEYNYITSGFIYSSAPGLNNTNNYYLVTNSSGIFHRYFDSAPAPTIAERLRVLRQGDFEITFDNGKKYVANLVGHHDPMDVAVFFINTTDVIPVPKMGSSDLLKLGDSILAIGTPSYGTQLINSLVKGTISGLARRQFISFTDQSVSLTPISVADYPAFQFDAPINGGMEGGPVINANGEIVGMISYKFLNLNSSVNNESISLATAIDDIKLPINQIIERGSYTRPTMGISVTDVNQMTLAQREQNAIEPNTFTGTFVAQVSTNSAASRAGMRANEVVIEIDGVSIFGITTVSSILHRKLFGDVINVKTINTNGVINEYRLTL